MVEETILTDLIKSNTPKTLSVNIDEIISPKLNIFGTLDSKGFNLCSGGASVSLLVIIYDENDNPIKEIDLGKKSVLIKTPVSQQKRGSGCIASGSVSKAYNETIDLSIFKLQNKKIKIEIKPHVSTGRYNSGSVYLNVRIMGKSSNKVTPMSEIDNPRMNVTDTVKEEKKSIGIGLIIAGAVGALLVIGLKK